MWSSQGHIRKGVQPVAGLQRRLRHSSSARNVSGSTTRICPERPPVWLIPDMEARTKRQLWFCLSNQITAADLRLTWICVRISTFISHMFRAVLPDAVIFGFVSSLSMSWLSYDLIRACPQGVNEPHAYCVFTCSLILVVLSSHFYELHKLINKVRTFYRISWLISWLINLIYIVNCCKQFFYQLDILLKHICLCMYSMYISYHLSTSKYSISTK